MGKVQVILITPRSYIENLNMVCLDRKIAELKSNTSETYIGNN